MTPTQPSDWKSLVDNLPDLVTRVDRETRHLYVNRQWEKEVGIPQQDVLGKTPRELGIPSAVCDVLEAGFQRVLHEGTVQEFQCPFAGSLGPQHYAVRMLPELGPGGEVSSVLAICRNISAQVAMETALAESETRFQAFMNHSPGVAWIKDADGRYVYLSPSYEQLLGAQWKDWQGKTDSDLWPSEIARIYRDNDLAVLNDGQTRQVIEEARNPDGTLRYWLIFKFLIQDAAGRKFVGGTGVDITERKLAEFNLQESDIWLRSLMETGAFVILGMTPDYRIFEWNRAAEQIYGWTREEVLGKDYLTHFLPEEARAGVAEEIRQIFLGRPTVAYPNEVLHRNGSRRTLLWNACRVLDGWQQVRGLLAIGQDITELQQAEAALRENEQRLQMALDASQAGTWSWDVSSRTVTWDRRNRELFEVDLLEPATFEGGMRKLHPEDRIRLEAHIQAMLEPGGGDDWNEEFRTIPLTDGTRWIASLGRVERDAQGRAVRFSGLNFNITERKRAELAVRQSAAEIQALMAAFPDQHFWLDADGTIRQHHAGARSGAPADGFLQRSLQDVVPPDVSQRLMEGVTRALSQGVIQDAEYSLGEPDGLHWYDARMVPLPDSRSVLLVIRDVTARRQAEEEGRRLQSQLQHTQKLKSLGVLAGGIAHDFNNILTSIMGFTDLALTGLPDGSPAQLHLDRVMTSARRAAELTQQMLAYSGKGQFVVQGLDLSDVIREIGPLLQMSVSKKARVRYQLHPKLPEVLADAAQLRQIIMNLIINASDALEDRTGEITVTTDVKWCDHEELAQSYLQEQLPGGTYVLLDVTDTGTGMDADTSSRIFEPFFTTKSMGRGLGLSAVLGIIRGHHGAIRVISEPGRGSTFRVLLPAASLTRPANEPPESQGPSQTWHGTVLVVDDEAGVRDLAQAMLERAGFSVRTACDGHVALESYRAAPEEISLVLLDLTMPGMSGAEALREFQRINPRVRVILSSGYNEQSVAADFSDDGAAGFLQKPYRYQDLLEAISQAMTHSQDSD